MKVLLPHLRVALTLAEFHQGQGNGFPEKYIIHPDNTIIKRVEGQHGMYFQYSVNKLPGEKDNNLPELKEEINYLPAGPVPISMLHKIIHFFRRVMTEALPNAQHTKTHGNYEAMAHIVWNPSDPQNYHIRIPTQKVTGGSVTYEFDHLEEGDVIVVDIHSHNNMGAFFSGVDDRDDQRNTCYSGVVGKVGNSNPETVWRFNDQNHMKIKCELDDIFATPSERSPDEWLNKVFTQTYANRSTGSRGSGAGGGRGQAGLPGFGGRRQGKGPSQGGANRGGNVVDHPSRNIEETLRLPFGGEEDDELDVDEFYYFNQGVALGEGEGFDDEDLRSAYADIWGGLDDPLSPDEEEMLQSMGFPLHADYEGYERGDPTIGDKLEEAMNIFESFTENDAEEVFQVMNRFTNSYDYTQEEENPSVNKYDVLQGRIVTNQEFFDIISEEGSYIIYVKLTDEYISGATKDDIYPGMGWESFLDLYRNICYNDIVNQQIEDEQENQEEPTAEQLGQGVSYHNEDQHIIDLELTLDDMIHDIAKFDEEAFGKSLLLCAMVKRSYDHKDDSKTEGDNTTQQQTVH